MFTRTLTNTRTMILASVVLAAATLACGIGNVQISFDEPTATTLPKVAATETPVPTLTNTPPPTPTPTLTLTPTPESHAISANNIDKVGGVRTINVASTWVSGISFSPLSHELATFGYDKTIRLWDADTGNMIRGIGTHGDWGLGLAYSPDGTLLVSGGQGADMALWDAASGRKLLSLNASPRRIYDIAWSPDSQQFAAVGDISSRLTVFDSAGQKLQEIRAGTGWFWSVAYSDRYLAASNDTTGKTYVYDSHTYATVAELSQIQVAGALDFSPDGSLLIGCHRDGTINVWDTSNWSLVKSWMAHPGEGWAKGCKAGTFTLDGSVYFSGGDEGSIFAWDPRTGALLKTFNFGVMIWAMSLSGDGELIAAGTDNGMVQILGLMGN